MSSQCTNADSDLIQTVDKNTVSSTNDKGSRSDCTASNKSASSQHNVKSMTCKKSSSKTEPAGGVCELTSDLKCAEKQSKANRKQRQAKRPDIQLYVPKPKQSAQQDHSGSTVSGTVSVKPRDNTTPSFETESASDWTKDAAESRKSAGARFPQSSAVRAPSVGRSSDCFDDLEPHKLESTSSAKRCYSKSQKSSAAASLSHCFDDLSFSANKTTEYRDSSKHMPNDVKQKVSKQAPKSQNSEPKQESTGCIHSSLASTKVENDRRGKSNDIVRSEKLDFDFDGEFEEYNFDGLSWGDLPPPSDHDWSDEECHDDFRAAADSAADTRAQKSRRQRAKHRRGARKKQVQNTEIVHSVGNSAAEEKLTNSKQNSYPTVKAVSFESMELEKVVTAAFPSAEGRESPVYRLGMNYDADDHRSVKARTVRYSHLCHQKDPSEKQHLAAVTNESEQRTAETRDQKNSAQITDKQQSDGSLKDSKSKREENSRQQRSDSGRVGGIIHLPVGVVTTDTSRDMARSSAPQAATSSHGRGYRSVHGGRRARWHSGSESESFSSLQHQGSMEPAQFHSAVYPSHYYQRHSASPHLYYTDYPPVSGASQMPMSDGYVYGSPRVAYDGLGYVDDSYYH